MSALDNAVPSGLPIDVPDHDSVDAASLPTTGAPSASAALQDSTIQVHAVHRPERRRGPGRRALVQLADQLSDRDFLVLRQVGAHRFLTTRQVERLDFQDHASASSAARVCRRVLRRLEGQGLLQRPLRRIGGLTAGSASSVWMLSSRGLRLLNIHDGNGAIGRVREPGERFVQHYLAVADTHLELIESERAGELRLIELHTEPRCWRGFIGLGGGKETLKPDLFAITANSGDYEDLWFIEVDRGTESLPTLLRQCRLYEVYRRHGAEQAEHGTFPLVLWIVPDQRRASKLHHAIQAARDLDNDMYRVATPGSFLDVVRAGAA